MRQYFFSVVMMMSATPALAQSYPQQPSYPQQEAAVTGYPQVPTTYPQPAYAAPAPQPAPLPPQAYYDLRPTDAGQSVITDVRQMNF